ncbi:MAG TPA: metal-dependent transcriptional regulator [Terriglobales bacterium]|nr:metal-dependent transcriptional regulator [Terriglobales bacterium]
MARSRLTVSKEDYLKAILEAEREGEHVISATLVHRLAVSAPAVTMAIRRLKKDGLVEVRQGQVQLTPEGRDIARRIVTRHHLIERMLSEIFGMDWYKVHDEAERLEHAVSDDFEQLLIGKLGTDGLCPHGNDAEPEPSASRRKRGLLQLSEAQQGSTYRVTATYERDRELLEFLDSRGIRPGVHVEVRERSYDKTVTLRTDTGVVSIGAPVADKVWLSLKK